MAGNGTGGATERAGRIAALQRAAAERILVLDGAMGTMIQSHRLGEADFRGDLLQGHAGELKGDNDLLCLTRPDVIRAIHDDFFAAGCDIVETNSFNATRISQADYGLEALVPQINLAAARIARAAADAAGAATGRQRFVAGALGPTSRTASISPDVNDPGFRNVGFDELKACYVEQTRALVEGGVDLILIETVFDTLNAKAAIFAVEEVFDEIGTALPLMVSGTITDLSGRNLSGQTVEAFWYSLRHARPFAVGLNCSFGAEQLRPHVQALSRVADTLVLAYPNAGLPNEMGEYDETPHCTAGYLEEWARSGLVNIVGGCCGTTPEHIRHVVEAVAGLPPRRPAQPERRMRLSGLEPFVAAG